MISLRCYPWLVDHQEWGGETLKWERETCLNQVRKMSVKDFGFLQQSAFFHANFTRKFVRRLFFLVLWSTIFVYRVSDLFKA